MIKLLFLVPILFAYTLFICMIANSIKGYIKKLKTFENMWVFSLIMSLFLTILIILIKFTIYLYV